MCVLYILYIYNPDIYIYKILIHNLYIDIDTLYIYIYISTIKYKLLSQYNASCMYASGLTILYRIFLMNKFLFILFLAFFSFI